MPFSLGQKSNISKVKQKLWVVEEEGGHRQQKQVISSAFSPSWTSQYMRQVIATRISNHVKDIGNKALFPPLS